MFGWEFPPYNSGGLGTACLGLTRALSRLGVEVSFVLPKRLGAMDAPVRVVFGDDYYKKLGLGGVSFREVDTLLTPYVTSESYGSARSKQGARASLYAKSLMGEVRRYGAIAAEIALNETFDVIHAHDWLSFPAGLAAKRATGKPLVVHVHATEFDRGGGNGVNQEVYEIERQGMEEADRVIAVSHWTKGIIVEKYGIPADKVSVVHNGVDETDFIRPKSTLRDITALKQGGNKIVLFAGRITIQKGPDYFVKMAKKVLDFYKSVYFVVSGSGDMERGMIEEVAKEGMADRFVFCGFLRGEELASVFAASDIYVMPSVSEPFGLIPLETSLLGTPALVSRQTGAGEVLTHSLKCDFWDVDEMANKVVATLAYPGLHDCLAENGKCEAKTIDWGRAAEKCAGVYDLLAAAA